MEAVNILIVDDEKFSQAALQSALSYQYQLIWVESSNSALRALDNDEFALVILGVHSLRMDIFKLARDIRLLEQDAIPIIFLTKDDSDIDRITDAYALGLVDFIGQPISTKILQAKVANLVELCQKTGQLARRTQQLHKSEQALDELIAQRTFDLRSSHDEVQRTNERLRAEVEERTKIEAQLRAQLDRSDALYNVTRSLVGQGGIDDLLRTVVDSVAHTLPAHLIAIIVLDMDAQSVLEIVLGGPRQGNWYPLTFEQIIGGLPGEALRTMRPVLSHDGVNRPFRNDSGAIHRDPGSVLVAPLHVQSEQYGIMMAINWGNENHFDSLDLELLSAMANQAAIAISQADIFDNTVKSLDQVRRVIQSVPSGVVLLDAQHRVLLKNPVAAVYIDAIAEVDREGRLLKLGETSLSEFVVSNCVAASNAQVLYIGLKVFEVLVRPLSDRLGKEQWILLLRDITTEMTALEHQLAQQRQAVVGQLAAGVAHDFNNILAVIILYCQLLQKKPDAAKHKQYLETIHLQADRGAGLISQLLDFGRQSLMKPRSIDLVPFFREILDLLSRTFPENIALSFTTHIETLYLHVDPTHLQQVFMNLAINARDAMSGDGQFQIVLDSIDVGLHDAPPVPGMPPGLWAKVTVTDTGCGMVPEVRDKIFEPFFTTKDPDQGTGLGLAQVYGIIQQLNGEITVSSVEREGTTFVVYLPLGVLVSVPLASDAGAAEAKATPDHKTILLVEDEPAVRAALEEMLATLGFHELLVAENGRDALERFRESNGQIDLVFSDMVMPKMGGLELFEALRDEQPNIKMIISTGYPLEQGGDVLLERGIVDWVLKPFSMEDVSTKIYKALSD